MNEYLPGEGRAAPNVPRLDPDLPLTFAPDAALRLDPALLEAEQTEGTVLSSETEGRTFLAKPDAFALFDADGHLTDPGLAALEAGGLGEIERLEAAEHLGFCTACMDRYTDLLANTGLLAPPADLVLPVARRVRQRGIRVSLRRYAAAAAAAALALGLWGSGVFDQMVPQPVELAAPPPAAAAGPDASAGPDAGLGGRVSEALNGLLGAAGDWCGGLFAAAVPEGKAPNGAKDAPAAPAQDNESAALGAAGEANAAPTQDLSPGFARAPARDSLTGIHADPHPDTAREGWPDAAQGPARTPASAMRGEE